MQNGEVTLINPDGSKTVKRFEKGKVIEVNLIPKKVKRPSEEVLRKLKLKK